MHWVLALRDPRESLIYPPSASKLLKILSHSSTPQCCLQGRYWLAATMETHLIQTAIHKGEVGGWGTRVNRGAHNHKTLYVLRVMDPHTGCNNTKGSADRGRHTPSTLATCSQQTVACCLQQYSTNPAVGRSERAAQTTTAMQLVQKLSPQNVNT